MSKLKVLQPALRFKGFEGDWESNQLKKIFSYISNNSLSRADLNNKSGLAKNIHYGDILIRFGDVLDIQKSKVPFVSNDEFVSKNLLNCLKDGDVIIADAAEDSTVGKCTEIHNLGNEVLFSGLHTIAIRPTIPFASKYLGYYLNSNSYHNQLLGLMQGTKVLSISKSSIKDTLISFPKSLFEQGKIGNFSAHIDDTLKLHQTKHTKLQQLKKAMLSKMFPKEGETVPDIRFAGFSGDWENQILADVSESYSGGTPTVGISNFYGGEIPFIRSGEINGSRTEIFLTNKGLNSSSAKLVSKGCILYALYGATSGEVSISKIDGAINQAILAIKPKKGYEAEFISLWLRGRKEAIISTYLQGGQGNLSAGIIKNLCLIFPSNQEQIKIGEYFKNLDRLIALQQQQIDKLQNIKKALLEKMFV